MDLALAVLLLWGLLFVPLGIVLHWLVLGEGSRVRALPLAPVTGIAVAVLVLSALGRFGIGAGAAWIPWTFIAVSLACVVVIWRAEVPWRSRELVGAGFLLLLAVILVQLPVVGEEGDGPLGTVADPVAEVAAIDAAAGGPAARLGIGDVAEQTRDERAIGFEQFAGLTVAVGLDEQPEDARTATWTAYGLHAPITGMLAALVTLPLFAFARARGVRWLGLVVLVPLGVVAPAVFLALANGEGAAIASVPFTTAAVFSLLVTRRDRGWWSLLVLFGAAVAATAGPLALLPLLAIGVAWMLLRSDTYEHLSQHDTPVPPMRSLVATAIAATLGAIAVLPVVARAGELLSWAPLHERLVDAVRSWPFAWLDSDLTVAGPRGPLETAIWLIGPALLLVAAIYAVVRNERRELGVLVGAVAAALVAAVAGLAEEQAGIRLFEFTMLSLSPFLAALAVRAVALARENADEPEQGRLAGTGPTLLVLAFVVLSFAATTVTGTRMVHAPAVAIAATGTGDGDEGRTTLVAAGDPWLTFVVDGERVEGGYADADDVSEEGNGLSSKGVRTTGYDQVVFSSSPLASDPALRYLEQSDLDEYQVRLFRDRTNLLDPPTADLTVDSARLAQRARTETADRPGAEREGAGGTAGAPQDAPAEDRAPADPAAVEEAAARARAESERALAPFIVAQAHTPVEGDDGPTPPDRPAGRLVPDGDVIGCAPDRDLLREPTCEPEEPLRGEGCTDDDVAAARAPDDRDRAGRANRSTARAQVLTIEPDQQLPRRPTMLGVQCFDVELASDSSVLLVHLRDVGLVLPPERARTGRGDWDSEREEGRNGGSEGIGGGTRRTTSDLGATLEFGAGRLAAGLQYDVVLEGSFGAGVQLSSGFVVAEDTTGEPDQLPAAELGTLRDAADGFSSILRGVPLQGNVVVENRAGTDISIGRLFARPRDLPRSCDVPIAIDGGQQRELRLDVPSVDGSGSVERPGLTVSIVDVTEVDGVRTARVAVGSYLTRSGLPRYVLVDWTQQYEDVLRVEGCDGVTYTEGGRSRPTDQVTATPRLLEQALGDAARGEGPTAGPVSPG